MSNSDLNTLDEYKKIIKEMEMILDNIPGLIFYKDTKNNFIRVNKVLADAHNLAKEEMEGKSLFDLYQKDQAQAYWDDDLEVIKNGKPKLNIEEPWETKEGLKWVSTNKIPYVDNNGKIIGIVGFSVDITERKKAEQLIKNEKKYLEDIMESMIDGVTIVDMEGKIVSINEATIKQHGYTREEAIGHTPAELFIMKEEIPKFYKVIRRLILGKPKMQQEYLAKRKDGSTFITSVNLSLLKDSENNPKEIIAVHRDITERKKGEEELKIAQEQLNMIFSNLKDTVFVISNDYKILFKNETAHDIFGSELVGQKCYEVIKGLDQSCERCPIKIISEKDVCQFRFEQYINTPLLEGERVFDIISSPIESYAGQPAIVEVLRDITERKKVEQELLESENKYKHLSNELTAILDHIPGIICYKDANNKFLRVNKYFADAHKMAKENMKGVSLFDLYPEDQAQDYWDDDLEVINSGKSKLNYEEPWESEEGTKWVSTSKIPFIDNDGVVKGIIVIATDITEKKLVEEELKEHRAHLEYLVGERIKELNCLYGLSKIIEEKDITKEEILKRSVELLPPAWRFPEVTCARIIVDNKEYKTDNFKETMWKQASDIFVGKDKVGSVEVYYLEEMPEFDGGPFLKEERNLIDAITRRLGKDFERINAEQKLRESEEWLSTTLKRIGDAVIATDTKVNISFLNPVAESLTGWKQEEAIEKPIEKIFNIINEETRKTVENPVSRVIREGVVVGLANHTALISKDGKEIPIADSGAPIKDKEGHILGVVLIFRDITERRKAEEKYRHLYDSITDGVMILDREWRHVLVNDELVHIAGMSKEKLLGNRIIDLFPGIEETVFFKTYQKVFKTGEPDIASDMFTFEDGRKGWYEVHVYPASEGLLIIVTNITDRKKAEEDLRRSREFLSDITAGVPGLIFQYELDTEGKEKFNFISEGIRELMGVEPEAVLADTKAIWDTYLEEYIPELVKRIEESVTNLTPWHAEYQLRHAKLGNIRWVEGLSIPKRLPDGNTIWNGWIRDITERKKIKQEFENIFNLSIDLMGIAGFDAFFKRINPAFGQILGYTDEELLAVPFLDFVHPDDRDSTLAEVGKLSEGATTLNFKNRYRCKDGSYRWIEWNTKPIVEDEIMYFVAHDVTERKLAEQRLANTMEELKHSNEELEQFAYVASHDLQEPLRMVSGFTQLLQQRYQDKLDQDANDFINFAVDGATRMQGLINDLLIFSRVGTHGKPFKATDMNVILQDVLDNVTQSIKETDATIIKDPLPVIIADDSQMIQLLQNLISNAIKFHGDEPPRIHVSGEVKANEWIFSVKDNGIGIDSKYFEKIFVIFQRLHKKGEYGGTGIGLAVCKKIVQKHGGNIWIESELGKGSTFYFTINKTKAIKE